jgi:acetyltransferase-like isoleucine patch superfamily enzyme
MPISPHALVSPLARLARDVDVGPFSVVHDGVEIGEGSRIGAYCEIGVRSQHAAPQGPLRIGAGALIRSHAVVYAGSDFGAALETGHRVTLREGTRCGDHVRIGTLSDIQGDCEIGNYVRMHSSVFVARGSVVRSFAWLMPRVLLTNDPTPPSDRHQGCVIDEYAVVAAAAVILPGVTIGARSLVAAGACVGRDVPAGMVARGVPARIVGPASEVRLRAGDLGSAYPWTRHFHRGYPAEQVRSWLALNNERTEDPDGA